MSDSLMFKGVKSITKHTGSEMSLVRPQRGGDIHQVKRWWGLKQTALYIGCAIFKVEADFGTVKLAIPTDNETTSMHIRHDGSGGFSFSSIRGCDRVGVFSEDMSTFYREYQFSRISGGAILTRTAVAYPAAATSIGTVSISGPTTAVEGTPSAAFSAAITGDAGGLSYVWTSSDGAATFSDSSAASTTITFSTAGSPTVSCEVSSSDLTVSDSPQSTISAPITVEESFATRVANATYSYIVNVATVGDPAQNVYTLDGFEQQAVTLNVGESVAFDFTAVGDSHPLGLFTDSTKSTPVTVGVETQDSILLFTPVVPATLSYQCINHDNMGGDITVS